MNLLRLLTGSTGGATPVSDAFARGVIIAALTAVFSEALSAAGVSPEDVASILGTKLTVGATAGVAVIIWGAWDWLDAHIRGFLGSRTPTAVAAVLKRLNERFAQQPGGFDIEKATEAAIRAAKASAEAQTGAPVG